MPHSRVIAINRDVNDFRGSISCRYMRARTMSPEYKPKKVGD